MFDYVAAYMYDGDTPLAERRAGALTLDRDLLRELLGQEELRELLDPDALADLELSLQALTDDRRATTLDGVHDLLRRLGDLSADEVAARTEGGAAAAGPWLAELASARRAVRTRIAGDDRWIAIEDVARYRDGVGIAPPVGIPAAFLGPAVGALDGLLARYARTHGPFLTPDPARRWGLPVGVVGDALERLLAAGTLLRGEFRPGGAEREWCDPEVLRLLRRRSLARLRREVEPVDPAALGRFLPDWQGVAPIGAGSARPPLRGTAALERLAEVVDQLAGLPIPASVLERDVLPARIPGYQPRLLDELGALGEVAWVGRGSLGRDDGRIALVRPGREILRPVGIPDGTEPPMEPRHVALREHLAARGASFYRELFAAARGNSDREVLDALWDLVWAGEVTNDTFAPLRALRWKRTGIRGAPERRSGPADRARAARGRRSLVARRAGARAGDPDRTAPRSEPRAARAARRRDPRGRRDRGHRGRVRRRLPGPAGDGGCRADPARLLRRRPRRRPVRARRRARPAARGARAGRPAAEGAVHLLAAADPANPYGAALPWPRRGETDRRPLQRAAGAYVVLVDGVAALYLERGGATLQTLPAADDPAVAVTAARALRDARRRRPDPRAGPAQDRRRGRGGLAVPAGPARGRVRGRLPRPRPSPAARPRLSARRRHALPDGGGSPAVPRRPDRHRGADRRARAPSRRWPASSDARSPRSSRSARTC